MATELLLTSATNTTMVPPPAPDVQPPWCLFDMPSTFWRMCDVDLLWGVIAEGMAGLGILFTFIAFIVFLTTAKYVVSQQASKNIYLLVFTFVGCFLSFIGSLSFVLDTNLWVCNVRRVLLSISWTFIHAPVLVLCTVTWAQPFLDEIRFCSVVLSTISLIVVEGIIIAEWTVLEPVNLTSGLCEKSVYTYPSAMAYNYFIMFLIIVSSIVAYQNIKKKHATQNPDELGVMFPTLFMTITTIPSLAGWAFMMIFGLPELNKLQAWFDPANSFFMIVTTYIVILFYILPILVTMHTIKNEELMDVEADDIPNVTPDVINRPIPMVALSPTADNGRNGNLTKSNSNNLPSYYKATPVLQSSTQEPHVNRVQRSTGKHSKNNNGHCNVTLELHEEDVMWKSNIR